MIRPPSNGTLRKYGLTIEMWYAILDSQGGKCPICTRKFTEELRPVIDHFHVRNFKKMKPEQKRKYIRGCPCNYCNRNRLPKGTKELSAAVITKNSWKYLKAFEDRSK